MCSTLNQSADPLLRADPLAGKSPVGIDGHAAEMGSAHHVITMPYADIVVLIGRCRLDLHPQRRIWSNAPVIHSTFRR
jgi:hypothetical protein